MPIQFDPNGSPAAILPGAPYPSPRQPDLLQYYNSLRQYEKDEFHFVIKTINSLFPNADCDAKATHTGGPMVPGYQADLSWGRLTGNGENIQDWVCRLICPGDKPEINGKASFPKERKFKLPRDGHFLSFTRRIAFPIRLYNRASGLPILIGGDGWYKRERDGSLVEGKNGKLIPQTGIKAGTAFLPYFCECDFASHEEFANFLKRWLDLDVLKYVREPKPGSSGPGGGGTTTPETVIDVVRVGITAGRAISRARARSQTSKDQTKKSGSEKPQKALEGARPKGPNAAAPAQAQTKQLPAPSLGNGDIVEGRHSADGAQGGAAPETSNRQKIE